jgi:hypothetical protein
VSVADDVKEAFEGKRGKVLIVGGGLAIAAYVWYTRANGTPEEVDPNATEPVVTEGSSRTPQTDPEVGNDVQGTPGKRVPANNAEWLADATAFLIGRGTNPVTAYNTLNKALGGEPVSTQEQGLVAQAIQGIGSPPDGMPPINTAPTPTQTNTVNAAPKNLRAAYGTKYGFSLYWDRVPNAVGYRVTVSGGGLKTPKVMYPLFGWDAVAGLSPGKTYTVSVAARNANGTFGPTATITARTPK